MKRLIIFLLGFTGLIFFFANYSYSNNIDELNAAIQEKGARWVAKETPLSNIPREEMGKWMGAPENLDLLDMPVDSSFYIPLSLPSSFDWTHNNGNFVTSIKNQNSPNRCGSCFVFAPIAALESKVLISNDMPGFDLDLSEQIVLSCSGAGNCEQGAFFGVNKPYDFLKSTGTYLERCYPYTATDGDCGKACANWETYTYKIDGWSYVVNGNNGPASLSAIKNALFTNGPVTAWMKTYEDFHKYGGGVYSYTSGNYVEPHWVLIVGWDDSEAALRCKSSVGTEWGEEGFFRISYNELYGTGTTEFGKWVIALGNVIFPIIINISVSPAALNFGNVNVGQSANQTVTISNQTNSTVALTGNVGSLSAPFAVVSGGGPFNLYPDQSLSVTVHFTPTSAVTDFGNLSITDNATNQTSATNIMLSGTGVIGPAPNLTPFQPTGWSDKIVVSNIKGTSIDSTPLYNTDPLYVDWAVINNGTLAASGYSVDLYVDGVLGYTWSSCPLLKPNSPPYVKKDYQIGPLSLGTHTIKIAVGNNEYTKTINILDISTAINLTTPSDNTSFGACSLYSPPTFSWGVGDTFKSYKIQFSSVQDFSVISVTVGTSSNSTAINSNTWKRVLSIPGGTVYWRVVGTRMNRSIATSKVCSIGVEPAQTVGNPTISPTSKASLPELSWQNNCNIKFKAWFGSDNSFVKKATFAFNVMNPNDNGGLFMKTLTSGQWTAIRKLVGDVSGSPISWYVESWDGLGRYAKTDPMSFVLID